MYKTFMFFRCWKRGLFLTLWLLKALVQKLSPARRLMLLVAFVLFTVGNWALALAGIGFYPDMQILGFVLLVVDNDFQHVTSRSFRGLQPAAHGCFINLDEAVKNQKPDGFEKSSSYGAQISAA